MLRLLPLALLVLLAACPKKDTPPPEAPPTPASPEMSELPRSPPPTGRAHYEGATASPLVQRFCASRPGTQAKLCERFVGGAVAAGHIELSEAAVDACRKAPSARAPGCAAPKACRVALVGKRAEKESCRSALECAAGLACEGLTTTEPGVCVPALGLGRDCDVPPDPLARAVGVDPGLEHGVCKDYCAMSGKCEAIAMLGQQCRNNKHCGAGAWCGPGRTCVPGSPPVRGCE